MGETITGAVRRLNASSVIYETSRIVKAGPGVLYGLSVFNSKGSAQWIQLHDSATLPADAAVPLATFTLATVANLVLEFGLYGLSFVNGIVVCNSSTGPTKTIGSADCFITARYA